MEEAGLVGVGHSCGCDHQKCPLAIGKHQFFILIEGTYVVYVVLLVLSVLHNTIANSTLIHS